MNISNLFTPPVTGLLAVALMTCVLVEHTNSHRVSGDSARLRETNGVTLFDQHPFTGRVIDRFPDGTIKREASYRDGRLDGTTRGWHANAKRNYVRTYVRGQEQGEHRGWYDNGQQRFEYHFANGVSQGVSKQWYPNGKPYTLFHFENGQEAGEQKMWDTEGKLRANYVIRNGRRYGLPGSVGCRGES